MTMMVRITRSTKVKLLVTASIGSPGFSFQKAHKDSKVYSKKKLKALKTVPMP